MPLQIESKKEGFRRCGKAFSTKRTEYPDGTFTADQIKILKAEPMLMVLDNIPNLTLEKDDEPGKPAKKGK
jgi:hypothetical protein